MSCARPAARATPKVTRLGHVGLRCWDVDLQADFYSAVLGLTVTDRDEELGMYFLSARPQDEHHELLLARGRGLADSDALLQQISFRCDTFDDVVGFFERFQTLGTQIDMVVSHGNAVGVYFYDPEGNRCEVYWATGLEARQPYVWHIDLNQEASTVLAAVRAHVAQYAESGFKEPDYVRRAARS